MATTDNQTFTYNLTTTAFSGNYTYNITATNSTGGYSDTSDNYWAYIQTYANTSFTVAYAITPRAICLNDSVKYDFLGQNSTQPLITANNSDANYNLNLSASISFNTTNYTLWLNDIYDNSTAINLTTTNQTFATNWTKNTTLNIYEWINCSSIFSSEALPDLNIYAEVYSCGNP